MLIKQNIENINCFDFVRLMMSVTIFFAHLSELSQSAKLSFIGAYFSSSFAIKTFFIISGFLVAKSFINTDSIFKYFLKRAKRILPAYVFTILFFAVVLAFFSTCTPSQYFSNIILYKYLFWNLIFMNFVQPCLPGLFDNNLLCAVNGALWTIKIEESFYILLPFLFYILNKTKKSTIVLSVIYLLSLSYFFVCTYYNKPLFAKQLPGQLIYFVTGIFLYLNFKKVLQFKIELLIISTAILMINNYFIFDYTVLYPMVLGLFVITFAYSITYFNNFGKYGDFTYGIYISHFPIIQLFRHLNYFDTYNPYLMACVTLFTSLIFSFFSWHFIEKRFLKRKHTSKNPVHIAV